MKPAWIRTAARWTAGALGVTVAAYIGYAVTAWVRYGRPAAPGGEDADALLDQFIPVYDVAERHHIRIGAPADITFSAACEADLMQSPVVRAIFRSREVVLGSEPDTVPHPRGVLALTTSIGWGVLATVPGREIVVGAVTQPWLANVVFRPLPPEQFAAFDEPDHVKIVWTLRADTVSATESVFRTETRAIATDATARRKFRRYWSFLSPGIVAIRWMTLRPVKAAAERRARSVGSAIERRVSGGSAPQARNKSPVL